MKLAEPVAAWKETLLLSRCLWSSSVESRVPFYVPSGIFTLLINLQLRGRFVLASASWEADGRSAYQEIPHLLWNQKVYYRVPKSF
jgi:hypothetical protein